MVRLDFDRPASFVQHARDVWSFEVKVVVDGKPATEYRVCRDATFALSSQQESELAYASAYIRSQQGQEFTVRTCLAPTSLTFRFGSCRKARSYARGPTS